jgi:Coenzyme PQQ synthesis protein D (PqqD)
MKDSMSEVCYRVNAPSVIYEKFDDELVAINLETGVYHSLAGPAADAFELLGEDATQSEVAEALSTRYTANLDVISAALEPFFDQLRKEDLICPVETRKPRGAVQVKNGAASLPFSAPTLEAYRDLQSLFLLDPVHEVGEEGWPSPASGSPET